MRAVTFHGIEDVRFERVAEPEAPGPGEVVVAVEIAGICGSDLHVVQGRETGIDPGTVLGHELVGTVRAVGEEVARFAPGDRVVAPFTTSCGDCYYCRRGLTCRCERGRLFGWVEGGAGLPGAQAEALRVPLADGSLVAVPAGMAAEAALLAGDVLATGWFGAESAGAGAGAALAVVGCGPVGLMAVAAAREAGCTTVWAIDSVPARLALAERFGGTPVALDGATPPAAIVRRATAGRGADGVVEAVGSPAATRLAFELARPGGTVAAVGVHTEAAFAFSPGEAYDKNLTYRAGRCPARAYLDRALALAARRPELADVVSHRLPLADGPRGYDLFSRKADGCTKVVLVP